MVSFAFAAIVRAQLRGQEAAGSSAGDAVSAAR